MIFLVILIGLCVGSFLNVCIYRLPKEMSIIKPASHCPSCNKKIAIYDNIPVLSYIILLGKCRNCRERIAIHYPIVEILTAVLFAMIYSQFNFTIDFFMFMFFFCILIMVAFIDLKYHAIPAYLCFIGLIVGLVVQLIKSFWMVNNYMGNVRHLPIVWSFKGMIVGFGLTYLFKFFGDMFVSLYLQITKKDSIEGEQESLGLGDVDFMGMVGVFMGIQGAVLVFFMAPFLALAYAIFAIIFKKSHLIPYLPYLSLAAIIAFFWGNQIINYLFAFLITR